MADDQREELTNEMHNFYNLFTSWETSAVRSGNLTLSESHAIEILGICGKINMKTLAEKLAVTRGTVTVTVDRLERGGYAKRVATQEDRRAYIIELTPEGKKAFQEHHQHHLRLTDELMRLLSGEETDAFINILRKLNEYLL